MVLRDMKIKEFLPCVKINAIDELALSVKEKRNSESLLKALKWFRDCASNFAER